MNALKATFPTAGRNTIFIAIFAAIGGDVSCLKSYIDIFFFISFYRKIFHLQLYAIDYVYVKWVVLVSWNKPEQ